MSIKKTMVKIIGIDHKPGPVKAITEIQQTVIYETTWDGDIIEWMEIGGEAAGCVDDYDRIEIIMT